MSSIEETLDAISRTATARAAKVVYDAIRNGGNLAGSNKRRTRAMNAAARGFTTPDAQIRRLCDALTRLKRRAANDVARTIAAKRGESARVPDVSENVARVRDVIGHMNAQRGKNLRRAMKRDAHADGGIEAAWTEAVHSGKDNCFIDARGRRWPRGVYNKMLARVLKAEAKREAVLDVCRENGVRLVRIVGGVRANTCSACVRWNGEIVSVNGARVKGYKMLETAIADGIFHPHCIHEIEPYCGEAEIRKTAKMLAGEKKRIINNILTRADTDVRESVERTLELLPIRALERLNRRNVEFERVKDVNESSYCTHSYSPSNGRTMIIVKVGRSDFVEASVAHEIGHALFQDIIENNGRHMLAFSKDFTIVDEIRDEIEKIIENLYGENWRTSLAGYDWIGKTTNGLRLYKYIVERDMSKESLKQSQISDQFVDMFAAADDFKYFARNHSSAPMPLGEMIADAFAVCYTSPDDLGKYIPRTRAAFEKFLIGQYT